MRPIPVPHGFQTASLATGLTLAAGLSLAACTSAWQTHLNGFAVAAPCGDCAPLRGQVRSDQFDGTIGDSLYTLTNALIHLESGGRIEAARLTLNGATGRFVTDTFTGHVGPEAVQLQVPANVELRVFDGTTGDGGDDPLLVLHGGRVSGGRSQITAPEIHLRRY